MAGIDPLPFEQDAVPLIIGERTNVIGSRKFKRLIREGHFERGAEIGRAQVRGGAHILDVCMADPDREELEDMTHILSLVTRMVKVPIMIDSTDSEVIEAALELCQGKSIINSINLEDGEEARDASRVELPDSILKPVSALAFEAHCAEDDSAITDLQVGSRP